MGLESAPAPRRREELPVPAGERDPVVVPPVRTDDPPPLSPLGRRSSSAPVSAPSPVPASPEPAREPEPEPELGPEPGGYSRVEPTEISPRQEGVDAGRRVDVDSEPTYSAPPAPVVDYPTAEPARAATLEAVDSPVVVSDAGLGLSTTLTFEPPALHASGQDFEDAPVEELKVSGTASKRERKRRIISAVVVTGVALLAANTAWGIVNRPPSVEATAQLAAQYTASDGKYAGFEAVGSDFLTAFLTTPTSKEALAAQRVDVNRLTAGEGGKWLSGELASKAGATVLTSPPVLAARPASSKVVAGGVSLLYTVQLSTGGGAPVQSWYGVVVAAGDDGRPFVAIPPSFMPNPKSGEGKDVPLAGDDRIAAAAEDNLTEFFTLWSSFGEEASEEDLTRLAAFVSSEPSPSVFLGMGGAVEFSRLSGVALNPVGDPAAPSGAEGVVGVEWRLPSGATRVTSYWVTLDSEASRWLVDSVLPV